MPNPLLDDRLVDLLLHDVLRVERLTALPAFEEHGPETFELYLGSCRRLARDVLFPTYKVMDEEPPVFESGEVRLHPRMKELFAHLRDLGIIAATRPEEVGGQQLPLSVATLAHAYLMAGNLSATGLAWLTAGAGHLLEAFGSDDLKTRFLTPMYEGRWTGTMALTEPEAGSSLADLTASARPHGDGTYRLRGAKIFISGAAHDVTENVVNLTLARLEGAPPGTRGISLFAVPLRRPTAEGGLEPNDVHITGMIHKIGWKALPSLAVSFGDRDDCHGWLVGEPHQGLRMMFQMMNEARIGVGVHAVATASVGFQEALRYARERRQGRPLGVKDPTSDPVPLIAHPDVRRMLLRMKAIVDAGLALAGQTALYADLAAHAEAAETRERSQLLLDLLTPVTKSFPAEFGVEANNLAIQVLGGYGYSSEYLPEALLRDQRLNPIHEGTTQIQSLDLLGRKAIDKGGAALQAFAGEVREALEAAAAAGLEAELTQPLAGALDRVGALTLTLGQRGLAGDLEGMLGHSVDYLTLFSLLVAGWQHLRLATAARARLDAERGDPAFARGLLAGARYWMRTEVPRIAQLADLCEGDDSYLRMEEGWF